MKKNKNQHYVPQYYLKNFAVKNQIGIYDLKTKKSFNNSISNTAYKKFFYNVDFRLMNKFIENEDFTNEDFVDKIINLNNESILATFFDSFNPTRDRILNKDNRTTISVIDFHSLVDFIMVQTYRNPKFSIFYKDVEELIIGKYDADPAIQYDKIIQSIVILMVFNELHYGRITKFKEDAVKAFKPIRDEIKMMKELLTDSFKLVFWNKTSVDFLTSDCAMSYMRLNDIDVFTTVFVPINTKIAVLLVNKNSDLYDNTITYASDVVHLEEADKQQVETHNMSIIEKANRFVYSMNGDFPELIKEVDYKPWWNIN